MFKQINNCKYFASKIATRYTQPQNKKMSLGPLLFQKLKNTNFNKTIFINGIDNSVITAQEFFKSSIQIAIYLKNMQICKGDIVLVVSNNGWEFVAIVIACFYLGAKVNLLNPGYSNNEFQHFFTFCKPNAMFCTKKVLNQMKIKPTENIIITDSNDGTKHQTLNQIFETQEIINFTPINVDPKQDVALILSSSGTTGLPKAVMLTHYNLNSTLIYFGNPDLLHFDANLSTIAFAPLFHMLGMIHTLASIIYESKCVILSKFEPNLFLKIIETYSINSLLLVPSILVLLMNNRTKINLLSLKSIFYGASPTPEFVIDELKKSFGHISFRNVWGMTEASFAVTIMPEGSYKPGSVGKAIANNEIVVCNEDDEQLEAFQVGELRVKGAGVMKGYFKDKKATHLAFDQNNFLKTGDVGYCDDEGFFYIIDRMKDLIKYKSFQVAPTELENLLLKHEAIKEAAVVGLPDLRVGEAPLAFVVKMPGSEITAAEIMCYVNDNISAQKRLYGGVRFIDELPKTSTGKIQRIELKKMLLSEHKISNS